MFPGWVKRTWTSERKIGRTCHDYWYDQHVGQVYLYQWDELHQVKENDWGTYRRWVKFEPAYGAHHFYHSQGLELTTPIYPTSSQTEYIRKGLELPYDDENQDSRNVIQRGEGVNQFAQVVDRKTVNVEALRGLAILRVCKDALAGCTEILYGENTFAFNAECISEDEMMHCPYLIPGMPQKGRISTIRLLAIQQ